MYRIQGTHFYFVFLPRPAANMTVYSVSPSGGIQVAWRYLQSGVKSREAAEHCYIKPTRGDWASKVLAIAAGCCCHCIGHCCCCRCYFTKGRSCFVSAEHDICRYRSISLRYPLLGLSELLLSSEAAMMRAVHAA